VLFKRDLNIYYLNKDNFTNMYTLNLFLLV